MYFMYLMALELFKILIDVCSGVIHKLLWHDFVFSDHLPTCIVIFHGMNVEKKVDHLNTYIVLIVVCEWQPLSKKILTGEVLYADNWYAPYPHLLSNVFYLCYFSIFPDLNKLCAL